MREAPGGNYKILRDEALPLSRCESRLGPCFCNYFNELLRHRENWDSELRRAQPSSGIPYILGQRVVSQALCVFPLSHSLFASRKKWWFDDAKRRRSEKELAICLYKSKFYCIVMLVFWCRHLLALMSWQNVSNWEVGGANEKYKYCTFHSSVLTK